MNYIYEEIDLEDLGFCETCHQNGVEERAVFCSVGFNNIKTQLCAICKLHYFLVCYYAIDNLDVDECYKYANKDIKLFYDWVRNRMFSELINNNVLDIDKLNKYLNENNLAFIDNKVQVK